MAADAAISFSASAAVRAAIGEVGRTEDVAVSPDGTRLALAAFSRNQVYVFSLAMRRDGDVVTVDLPACVCLRSDSFRQPHGCLFLDDGHLLVCSRGGDVSLIQVPDPEAVGDLMEVHPVAAINGGGFLNALVKTPGSAAGYWIDEARFRAFVCSDQWHFVTSHVFALGDEPRVVNEGIRIESELQIPDGISLSPDRNWVAVSNHVQGQVQIWANTPALDRRSPPVGLLDGSVCPHGLSFDGTGDLYVADAASPYVHYYRKPPDGWLGHLAPSASIRMLPDETFYKGRYAAREGGIKGLHVDAARDVLVTTHKLETLAFHDLRMLRSSATAVDADQLAALRRGRDDEIALTKSDVLQRRWRLHWRLRKEIGTFTNPARANLRAVVPYLDRVRLARLNRRSKESLLDPAGPILSLTSHSTRIQSVHLAVESIGQGRLKPRRILLWLADEEADRALPDSLLSLVERGLEIRYTPDLGPHTKYYPYVASQEVHADPVVTADDDIIYEHDWLAMLVEAHEREPDYIHCHRARRVQLEGCHFAPYGSWGPAPDSAPHPLNFCIGASGAIYPAAFLSALRRHGTGFLSVCPQADDVWLNWVAHREGFPVAQVASTWPQYREIPASQVVSLSRINIGEGGNQLQLADTYSPADRSRLLRSTSNQPAPGGS
jgi:hypothetical protein